MSRVLLFKMKTSQNAVNEICQTFTCGRCCMFYYEYKHLLEHLYWKHGTESQYCKTCGLRKWRYAAHLCNVLPIDDVFYEENSFKSDDSQYYSEKESEYCCGKWVDNAPMIGCDGPRCSGQWYHFTCVGVVTPPDGEWFCPVCVLKTNKQSKILSEEVKT